MNLGFHLAVNDDGLWSNRLMLETPDEIARLQHLLDRSAAGAGAHLRGIITDERRMNAEQVCQVLQGMRGRTPLPRGRSTSR